MNIRTTFGMGGKFNTHISSPKFVFTKDGTRVESQGLNLNVESDKSFSFVNTLFDIGGLTASNPNNMALTVGKISYRGKSTLSSNGTYVGTDSGEIASVNFVDTLVTDKPLRFSTGKIGVSSSATAEGAFQNITFKTQIDVIAFNAQPIGKLTSNTTLAHLDAKALSDLNTLQIQSVKQMLQCKAAPDGKQARLAALSALLEKDPEFKFTLDVASDVGATQLTTSLNSKGLTAKDLQNFNDWDWKNKIQASIAFQTPLTFVEKLFTLKTEAANKEAELSLLNQIVKEAINSGFIVQDGKTLKFDATLKQGAITLNGKPKLHL